MNKLTTLSAASLIKVQFFHPKKGGVTEFYFGLLAAIYEMFDASDVTVGLKLFGLPTSTRRIQKRPVPVLYRSTFYIVNHGK